MSKKQSNKKQNPPYYMKNGIEIDEKIKEKIETPKNFIKPFQFHIIDNENCIISIKIWENETKILNKNQFHAFTLAVINIAKKINPEIDYIKLFNGDNNEPEN